VHLPHHLEILLQQTAEAMEDWQGNRDNHTFVPADYVLVFDALCAMRPRMPVPKPHFLEWGSGLGVVTMLAASLGWMARGIELQPGLVRESRSISRMFDIPATFLTGSFFPQDKSAVEKLEEICHSADLLYVYPWPDQELELFDLFDRMAKPGAYLLTYYGTEDVRAYRKG
ncbi:MAG: hypothetical protein WD708_04550, partial [Kiritimatiellia bacterium]